MRCPLQNDFNPANQYACEFVVYGSHCHWLGMRAPKGLLDHNERHGDPHQENPASPEVKRRRNNQSQRNTHQRTVEAAANGDERAIARLKKLAESNAFARKKYQVKRRKK